MPKCPLSVMTDTGLMLAIKACDFVECGILPNAGGLVDQTMAFVELARFIAAERAQHERPKKKGK